MYGELKESLGKAANAAAIKGAADQFLDATGTMQARFQDYNGREMCNATKAVAAEDDAKAAAGRIRLQRCRAIKKAVDDAVESFKLAVVRF